MSEFGIHNTPVRITHTKFTEYFGDIYDRDQAKIEIKKDVYGTIIGSHTTKNKRGHPIILYVIQITSIPPFYVFEHFQKGNDATSSVGSKRKHDEHVFGYIKGEFRKSDSIMRIYRLDADGIFALDNNGHYNTPINGGGTKRHRKTKRAAKRARKTRR
jgi:hypothetical protein